MLSTSKPASQQLMPSVLDTLPQYHPRDRRSWRRWLEQHHADSRGVWLIFDKKTAGRSRLPYGDAVEEALCFGWVDSLTRSLDDSRYMQLYTPRKSRSGWSRSNKERVARMIEAGLMTPAGLAKIEVAQRDGSWTRLDSADSLEVPTDLARAFRAHPGASKQFNAFSNSVRRAILAWIASAKKPETRAARVAKTARMAAVGKRAQIDKE